MKRKMKRFFAALMAGALICSNLPMDAIAIEVNAAQETQIEAQETLGVSFDSQYAQVGEALSVTVTGATEVSYQWYVGGKQILNNTNSYTPTESDLEQWIKVVVTSDSEEVSTELYCSKLPVVYIDTNGQEIVSKEDYIDATMTIQGNATYNPETSTLYDGAIEIRGRGNSTWPLPKKPYKIKLDKKTDVFGMGKNKHWVLLANFLDESLMRNTLAYDLSGAMEMNQMSTVWVDVVMNGEYIGNYQFCEQVRVDETRVDVFDWEGFAEDSGAVIAEAEGLNEDDMAEYMLENMGWITSGEVTFNGVTYQISDYPDIQIPSIDGGYILELDEYYDEISKFTTNSGQPIMFKNPEFVKTNDDMMAYVQAYVQAFEDAVMSSDYTATYEEEEVHYSELYDFDALVDYWIVSEIFFNEEFNKKSTYMYKEIGELMKMGPIWDMDWSSGAAGTSAGATDQWATSYFNVNAQKNQWYKYLVQDPYFLMKVQERYWEVRGAQVQDMLDSIDVHYEYLKESGAADTERWSGRISFESDVENLQNWLNTHVAWMDEQMATEDSLSASFGINATELQLALTDSNGNALESDTAKNAPADGWVESGTDLKLAITGSNGVSGAVEVFVNGQRYTTATVDGQSAEVTIPATALTAEAGEKNIIEVKVVDNWGNVSSTNYVTVREGIKKEAMEVSLNNTYAQVGEALSVTEVAGASYEWYVDGKQVSSNTNSYIPRESDLEKWIEVVVSTETHEGRAKLYCSKLPVVYIDTNGQEIVSKEDYIDATMTIQGNATYNSETSTLYDGVIEIRGRGNSTWPLPKKPYKIKLDKKTDVFGMGKNKHWVLLANYLDESLMRNTLAYDLSGAMEMNQMSTVWVDVVMNGEYIGNYQFCEQVRVDETRVDVFDWEGFAEDSGAVIAEAEGLNEDDMAEYMLENMGWITSGEVTFNGETYQISDYEDIQIPSIDGGYVLELDEYYDEKSKFYTNSGQPIMFKNPEFVATNDDMMAYVQAYVQAFEDAVMSSDYTATYEDEEVHYSELYDFDALVDYWIISEIFFNEEFNKKSTYMYKEIGELMKMGPIWDMDWSSGAAGTSAGATNQWATNYFSSNAQARQWYKYLVQDPYFLMKVQERYWEIRGVQVQDMLDSIDVHYEYLKESGAADTERWAGSRVSFDSDVANLQNWLNTHVAWMDRQMATEDLLNASFYSSESELQLALTDSEGNTLKRDGAAKAAADNMTEEGTDLVLSITGTANIGGTAEIYVNSQKYKTATVSDAAVEVEIPSEILAATGEKNTIEVKVMDSQGNVTAANYITVREYAAGEMPEEPIEPEVPMDPADSSKDYDVSKITYTTGSNSADGEGIELAFDGNENTFWHTEYRPDWYGKENCANYLWVKFELEEKTVVDAIRYLPRQDASKNGNILEYRVEGTVDGENWSTLTTGTWTFETNDWKVAEFDAVALVGLRLVATSTHSDGDADRYASAAELRVRTTELVDFTALAEAIEKAEEITRGDYTEESWTAFQSALTAARSVNENADATQRAVDRALENLQKAQGALEGKLVNPFKDVSESDYYYDEVLWAYSNKITSGTSTTTFAPSEPCTRGQIVTFLWNAEGRPAPKSTENPFTDVDESAYYYQAVLWAVGEDITKGTSEGKFSPDEPCTRGQIVTFLWNADKRPTPNSTENPFTDVKAGSYYYDAILWAVENKLAYGVDADSFEPDVTCTRGQIVTFLYRYNNIK